MYHRPSPAEVHSQGPSGGSLVHIVSISTEFVRRRHGSYQFRRVVPLDLRKRLARREVVRSLGPISKRQAGPKARRLWVSTERAFELMRTIVMTPERSREVLEAALSDSLYAMEARLAETGELFSISGPAPLDFEAEFLEMDADEMRTDLANNDVDHLQEAAGKYAQELGIGQELSQVDLRLIAREIIRGRIQAHERMAKTFREDIVPHRTNWNEDRARAAHDALLGERFDALCEAGELDPSVVNWMCGDEYGPLVPHAETAEKMPDVLHQVVRTDPTNATEDPSSGDVEPTFEEAWGRFAHDQVVKCKWRDNVARQARATLRAFRSLYPSLSISDVRKRHAREFQRQMLEAPALYAKARCWRDMPLTEIVSLARKARLGDPDVLAKLLKENKNKQPDLKVLSKTTWNRHASHMRSFWEWLRAEGLVRQEDADAFAELHLDIPEDLPREQGGSDERPMWELEQQEVLFSSPLFTGYASARKRHLPGRRVKFDALFWVPIIIACTGMRREELAAALVGDIRLERSIKLGSDITYFDLKDIARRLKDPNSRRFVPLHPHILELGFLECCVDGRDHDELLFPDLATTNGGSHGDKIGKWFGRYRRSVGIDDQYLDLHAFRHSVATHLKRAGVPKAHAEEITGHASKERKSTFDKYDKGSTVEILYEAIIRLPVGFLEEVVPYPGRAFEYGNVLVLPEPVR